MSFDEYIKEKLPEYKTIVSEEKLAEMRELYKQSQDHLKRANDLIDMAFKYPEMNYDNNRNKNLTEANLYSRKLDAEIAKYGTSLEQKEDNNMHM